MSAWIVLLLGCASGVKPDTAAPSGTDSGGSEPDSGVSGGVDVLLLADNDPGTVPAHWITAADAVGYVSEDGSTIEGTLDYSRIQDGETWCDLTTRFSGTAVSGVCDGCDYTFHVDTEIAEDRGSDSCDPYNSTALLSDGVYVNLYLGFRYEYTVVSAVTSTYETYRDVLLVGSAIDRRAEGGAYYPGPYWGWQAWDGPYSDYGWAGFAEGVLSWGMYENTYGSAINHYAFCNMSEESSATTFYGGTRAHGELSCSFSYYTDGWGVEVEAGQDLYVSVDLSEENVTFNPYFFINGPDGCAVTEGIDNFVCSKYADISVVPGCPSAHVTAEQSGLYEIWVFSTGLYCGKGPVDYELYVDLR